MSGLLKTIASHVAPALRGCTVTQKATLYIRPAKENISPVDIFVGMVMFSLTILGPSGWILAHMKDYKQKQ
uniref:cytochrome c oxidase subunit 8A, mitochondrial n=1 Tax=Monopterus albus TaxID=43700 RepID=UPI0009B3E577|nr:cytochrome c oxidase subunit 8B, mitochondrial-like [Monopterus albus]